jgi:thiol-disulfide isomerase/thioredoxin
VAEEPEERPESDGSPLQGLGRRGARLLGGPRVWKVATATVLAATLIASFLVVALNPIDSGVDMKAPGFTLEDMEGETIELRDHLGQVVLLDFMATWCPTCNSTVSTLNAIYADYSDRGLWMVSVSTDPDYDMTRLEGYALYHGSPWPHALDFQGVRFDYRVAALPTIVIIDQHELTHYVVSGGFTYEEVAAELDRLL